METKSDLYTTFLLQFLKDIVQYKRNVITGQKVRHNCVKQYIVESSRLLHRLDQQFYFAGLFAPSALKLKLLMKFKA